MTNYIQSVFTDSAFGALDQVMPWGQRDPGVTGRGSGARDDVGVEAFGFPSGTDPQALAEVLRKVHAALPLDREALLRRPGFLARICSQSAARASYAIWILAIAESPDFHAKLAKLGAA